MDKLWGKKLIVAVLLGLIVGCVSEQSVQKQISLCPEYFQKNIGEVKILPFWTVIIPLACGPVGWMNKSDPNISCSLTPLADKATVFHEMFHTFEWQAAKERPGEWQRFQKDFCNGNVKNYSKSRLGPIAPLMCMAFPPIGDIPIHGHVRFYGLSWGAEDTADCFAFWMIGRKRNDLELMRKCEVVGKFARGEYQISE